jgi:divalent metal cation (Fe/Co/Zn/Cd) transporter
VTAAAATIQLVEGKHPETTAPGMAISAVSLSFMFFLWKTKKRAGEALGSATVLSDAQCSLACIQLSFVLFAGSLLYWLVPALWWADAAAALLISVFVGAEGRATIRNARSEDFSGGCCPHD